METPEGLITPSSKRSDVTVKPDDVLEACGAELLDEARCRNWLIRTLHPEGIHCPFCGTPAKACQVDALQEGKWVRCQACPRHFSAFSKSTLSKLHWRCTEFVQLLLFFSAGWSVKRIATKLECSESAVRSWESRVTDKRKRTYVRRVR